MKVISLNTWGGRVLKPLLEFFKKHEDIDIFCLQEIYHGATKEVMQKEFWEDAFNLYSDIQKLLPHHDGYFKPVLAMEGYGLAIFSKKDIKIDKEGDISIYEVNNYQGGGNHSRNLQYLEFIKDGKKITVANVHGLWNGNGKTDTKDRLEQSRIIKEFLNQLDSEIVLCGDFNLLPDTESLKILEDQGMKNLIKEFDVKSTRSSHYDKAVPFADYTLISRGIRVNDFKVLPDEVSDHLAMYLDFE